MPFIVFVGSKSSNNKCSCNFFEISLILGPIFYRHLFNIAPSKRPILFIFIIISYKKYEKNVYNNNNRQILQGILTSNVCVCNNITFVVYFI